MVRLPPETSRDYPDLVGKDVSGIDAVVDCGGLRRWVRRLSWTMTGPSET